MGQDKAPISGELLEHSEAARVENGQPAELVSEAVRQRLDDRKWRDLVEAGNRRAQALGLTEDDLPRLITEARRERHAG
jgi:hypothetical protein